MTPNDSSLALYRMIRFFSFAMLFLLTSVWGVDAAHGWSHVELSDHDHNHDHDHSHDEDCKLCEWDVVVVPEPFDLQLIPLFMTWPVRLERATIGEEHGLDSAPLGLLPGRGPPRKA